MDPESACPYENLCIRPRVKMRHTPFTPQPACQQPTPGAGGSSVGLSFTLLQSHCPCGKQGGWNGAGAQVHPLQLLGSFLKQAPRLLPIFLRILIPSILLLTNMLRGKHCPLFVLSCPAVCADIGKGGHGLVKRKPWVR